MRVLLWLVASVLLCACEPAPPAAPAALGQPERIISLAPHLTELAFAAGAGGQLVGVVAHSDFPAEARYIASIGDAFSLDYERIAALDPDLVLAWDGGTPAAVQERLISMGYRVLPVSIRTLDEVPARLLELATLAGNPDLAASRATRYRKRLRALARKYQESTPVSVFYQISLEPLYTVGGNHFISELIGLCGGQNIFADLEPLAAAVTHEAVLARSPGLVLVGAPWLTPTRELWDRLAESAGGIAVAGIDADLVTRPGLRLAEGAEQICARLKATRARGAGAYLSPRYGLASIGPPAPAQVLPVPVQSQTASPTGDSGSACRTG